MNFDDSWREPTEAQLAAWRKCCVALGVPKKDIAWFDEDHKRHALQVKSTSIGRSMAVDAECIHPDCHNLIAPRGIKPREGHFKNYRGLGACQRGHQSYYCTKCKKPHSHTSKVGKAHFEEHYGCDFTAEAKAAWGAGEDPLARTE